MNNKKYLDTLMEILKIKSISTQNEHLPDMKRAREFLVKIFSEMGFKTKILKGKRHDLVFAQRMENPKFPTILIYGHYDVQPPEPLEEWKTEPFVPTIKAGILFARGATDNKGQFMVHVNAVKQIKGLNFKFLIEGEEEIGSISIESITRKYGKKLLKSDYIIVSDSEMLAGGTPCIDIGLRGLTYTEIFLETAKHDMHSGQFGGLVENPANALSNIISRLKDSNGKVLIPRFYDSVILSTKGELKDFNSIKVTPEQLAKEGSFFKIGKGENNFNLNERRWTRPTLDVNGLTSGYQGEGSKTIIPAKASAKISMRLVPNQNPEKIYNLFVKYVRTLIPKTLKAKFIMHAGALPYKSPATDPVFALMKTCLKKVLKKEAVFTGVGGSIGFVPIMANALKVPCVMVGWGLPDENLHAPNEHFSLDNFYKGIEVMKEFYATLPKLKKQL